MKIASKAIFKLSGSRRLSSEGFEVHATATFENAEDAQAVLALLPKSANARYYPISNWQPNSPISCCVTVRASLKATGVAGASNETGAQRMRSVLNKVEWEYQQMNVSNFATELDLMVAIFGQ